MNYMQFPGGKQRALTLSYDDGVQQDIRLIEILDKHGIKCTFNINGFSFEEDERSFPKGHMERGETEYMIAVREVFEETSVQIRIDRDFRQTVHYHPLPGVSKEVVYFMTETKQESIRPQEGEIAQVEWVPVDQAEDSLTHENDKTVFRSAMENIKKHSHTAT